MKLIKLSLIFIIPFISICAQEKLERVNYELILNELESLPENADSNIHYEIYNKINPNDSIYDSVQISKSYYKIQEDKYDEALEIIESSFESKTANKLSLYVNKGVCLREKELFEEAILNYNKALIEFPLNSELFYYRGIVHEKNGDIKKAYDDYVQAFIINPTNTDFSLQLGSLLYKEQKTSQALMILNLALMVSPDSENSFSLLNSINTSFSLTNDSKPTGIQFSNDDKEFEDLDLILNNGVALNKSYKINSKIDVALVRQTQVLFEQISSLENDNGDFWTSKLIPFFNWVSDNDGYFNTYINTICYSIENTKYKKIVEKDTQNVIQFYSQAMSKLEEVLGKNMNHTFVDGSNLKSTYLYSDHLLVACGQYQDNKTVGEWMVYDNQGRPEGYGSFNEKGKRTGLWTWLNTDGTVYYTETYENGELNGPYISYYDNGTIRFKASYKDDQPFGLIDKFNKYGLLVESLSYKEGKLDGPYVSYYNLGSKFKEYEGVYKEGNIEGVLTSYYDDGSKYSEVNYTNGKANGIKTFYFRNGDVKSKFLLEDDLIQGDYIRYHENGNIAETGQYTDDNKQGLWKLYNYDGVISEEINYNNDKKNGIYKSFDLEGDLYYQFNYNNNLVVGCTHYDQDGNQLDKAKKKSGGFNYKGYSMTGQLSTEGYYNVKGGHEGTWKYFENGYLQSIANYTDGDTNGEQTWYYPNGQISSFEIHKDDEIDGYDVGYYSNGQIKDQGYYTNGKADGVLHTYFIDGTLNDEYFYHKNELHGLINEFGPNGELYSVSNYEYGDCKGIKYFYPNGELLENVIYNQSDKETVIKHIHYNGKTYSTTHYVGNIRHGMYESFHFNGQLKTKGLYHNGERNGEWLSYDENGNIDAKGVFNQGSKDGKWEYYEDGILNEVENYVKGNLHGKDIYYNKNGEVTLEMDYYNNKLHGERKSYDDHGNLMVIRYYYDGLITGYSYLKDGKLLPIINLEDGTGKLESFYDNGQPSVKAIYKNNLYQEYESFHNNGKTHFYTDYNENGENDGVNIEYYENGNVLLEENYLVDHLHGVQKEFYENGKLKSEVTYKNGHKDGEAKYYDISGKLKETRVYFYGNVLKNSYATK